MFEVIKETNPYGSVDDILKIENTESTQIEYTFGDILTIDNEYTFSLWVRSTGTTKTSVHISNQTGEFNLTSEWRRIKFTAQSNIATSKEVYFSIAPNTTLYCYEGQLESGNVATDFKLNPADLMASIDEVNSSLSVLQTDFKVEQGKIETLIKDTTIDGTKLKDKYLQTVETVDGMKTTINSLETDIDGLTSKTTTIETSVDGIKTQVSSAVSKADQANNRVDDLEERADSGEFDGKGVQGTPTTVYQAGTSATNPPSGTWSSTIPTVTAGQYLWSKTTITYTDGSSTPIYSVVRSPKDGEKGQAGDKGETGDTGKGISSIVHHYLASSSASGVTTSTSGWSSSPQSVTSSKKYLWYYQTINYTTGSPTNTTPAIIGVYGDTGGKGADGKGIKSVQPQYYLSSSNTTQTGGSWSSTQPAWASGKYYWTRDHITWSDNSTSDTTPVLATALNNANQVANEAQTIAEQTSDKFTWIVKSGSNETNFTLTDRTAQLVADNINLKGLVTFSGLNSETQEKINNSSETIDAWGSSTVEEEVTQINGGYIQTNTINAEQLNVENIFSSGSAAMNIINAQEINANRITSGTIKASYLELYGLAVLQKETNLVTLSIDSEGNTTMRGTVESYNYNAGKTGWSIKNTGDAEFNDVTVRGSVITNDGGIVSSGGTGRNLALGTGTPKTYTGKNINNQCAVVYSVVDYTILNDAIDNKQYFVVSFDYELKHDSAATQLALGQAETPWLRPISLSKEAGKHHIEYAWKHTGYAFTTATFGFRFDYFEKDNEVTFSNFKVELGDVATAWSPAPEDAIKQVRFWAGSSYESRESAPFIVYNDGSVKATRGEFGGVFSGTVEIGNITIEDPSKTAGGDALLTIQNGQNGVKRIQLKDTESSTFAQNLIVSDNQYNSKITLNQDGSGTFTSGVYIGDSSTSLLANQLNLKGNILSSETGGFYFDSSQVSIGTTSHNSLLNVRGNIQSSGNISLDGTLSFGDVVTFKPLSNGLDINVLK